jgi:hypothetical protein
MTAPTDPLDLPAPAPLPDPLPADPHERAMLRAFGLLAFTMNRFIVDQMVRSARHLGGDHERLVIWGVLAHLNVAHLMPPGSLPRTVLDDNGTVPDAQQRMRPMLLRDLAQITGIPRETARRKLESLREDGWVLRTVDGWVIDAVRSRELRGYTLEGVERFLQTARAMEAVIADAAQADRAPPDGAPTTR